MGGLLSGPTSAKEEPRQLRPKTGTRKPEATSQGTRQEGRVRQRKDSWSWASKVGPKWGVGCCPAPGPQRPGHFPGVCPPCPVHLVDFMLLELLQLLLEAQVGVGAGAASAHCMQRIFPAQIGHCHEVGDDQRHAPRHSG